MHGRSLGQAPEVVDRIENNLRDVWPWMRQHADLSDQAYMFCCACDGYVEVIETLYAFSGSPR
jgi:hypothetical protein